MSWDPLTGCQVTYCLDTATGKAWWEHEYDRQVRQNVLDAAAALRNAGDGAWQKGMKGAMVHCAIIPREVRHLWRTQGIDPDSKDPDVQRRINKMLNGEFKNLKTVDKKL